MKELPLKLQLPSLFKQITEFRVVHFQDNKLTNPGPHWYIAIPVENSYFLISIITSKGKEKAAYYGRTKLPKAAACLVPINNNEFTFLSKDSVVNCNETDHVSVTEWAHRIDETVGFKIEAEKVPAYLRKEIVSAIVKSPIVPKMIGNLAKKANPV